MLRLIATASLFLSSLLLAGCGQTASSHPRTPSEIEAARKRLPVLYITAKTHKEVLRPRIEVHSVNDLVDSDTHEILWIAQVCENPECPGKHLGKDGRPYLFINPNPLMDVNAEGKVFEIKVRPEDYSEEIKRRGGYSAPTCPECYKRFHPGPAEQPKYSGWVKEYVPPEAIELDKQLDDELKAWNAYVDERSKRKAVAPE